jgi:hypothetical protein
MRHRKRWRVSWLASVCWGIALAASPVAHAATFLVINSDSAGEGFNDPTPVAPVGGNSGTTLGAQRLIAFQRAVDIWAARLTSPVAIRVRAAFNTLACSAASAKLGSTVPLGIHRDFPGAPFAGTWYPLPLANALRGADGDPGEDDIETVFNRTVGTTCAFPKGFYYGLDLNAGANIDFVSVAVHELAHGLGFYTPMDLETGTKQSGFDDIFTRFLENHGATPPDFPSMSNAQRVAAVTAGANLHWTGTNVRAASGLLSAGKVGDHVRMYAPGVVVDESAIHFDTSLAPTQVMGPSYTVPLQNPILELRLLRDLGWTVTRAAHDFNGDGKSDILWRNSSTGAISVWLMNGALVQQAISLGQVANTWSIVGQRDFDGSARHDMLWRSNTGGTFVWFLNGAGVTSTADIGTVPIGWTIVGTGDFNADGRGDVLWRDGSGNTAIWLMNGGQLLQNAVIGQVPSPWTVVGTADFNGDGKADILWRNTSTGTIAIWLMNGVQIVSTATIPLSVGWNVAATGDLNADGKADMLWRQPSTGNVAMWFMNGVAIASTAVVGNVPSTWVVQTANAN